MKSEEGQSEGAGALQGPRAPGGGGRFSARRKREIVVRLLRGEDLERVSRELGVTAATLSEWRERFLLGAEVALKRTTRDERDEQVDQLRSKLGEILLDNELLRTKIQRLEQGLSLPPRRSRR
jgi:hypothetical protein